MVEQIQELINKIKQEGTQAAEVQAKEIADQANASAKNIIDEANKKANDLIEDAKKQIDQERQSTQTALKQASRDVLLSLRKEIEELLKRIIKQEIKGALEQETLTKILENVVKNSLEAKEQDSSIEIAVGPDDMEQLKQGFIEKLQKQLKETVTLKSSDDIDAGFTISFDSGASSYDFSDESLSVYLSNFLNEQVALLLKEE